MSGNGRGRARRRGLTLVEVLLALAVGASVLMAARGLLSAATNASARIQRSGRRFSSEANAYWGVRLLASRAQATTAPEGAFSGDSGVVHFSSWCDAATGAPIPCRLRMEVTGPRDTAGASARVTDAGGKLLLTLALPDSTRLRYLQSATLGGEWLVRWDSSLVLPLALGLASPRETLVFVLGQSR